MYTPGKILHLHEPSNGTVPSDYSIPWPTATSDSYVGSVRLDPYKFDTGRCTRKCRKRDSNAEWQATWLADADELQEILISGSMLVHHLPER